MLSWVNYCLWVMQEGMRTDHRLGNVGVMMALMRAVLGEQEKGKRPWWAGRWRVGLGVARPRGPYLPDCCSPDAFTATAWPIQPADLIPSSPPLQAPLCLPRRLKALAASSSGERKSRT